ncbi:MAG: hypothetical protein ABEJ69_02835 [Candidatus Nanohaloarchaea archaeon]
MLDIFDALENGFDRAYGNDGLVLTGIFFVLTTLNTIIGSSLTRSTPFNFYRDIGFGLPLPNQLLVPASLAVTVLVAVTTIAAMRIFVESRNIGVEVFKDRMLYAFLNIFIGSILYGLIVFTGLLFFVLPGIFLMVALFYWQYRVAVENENFIEALRGSWQLASGERLRLFGLLFATVLVMMAISFAFSLPMIIGLSFSGLLIAQAGNAFGVVVAISVLAEGYNQLKE